ncbi:MAG: DUF1488 domain-containing protein [Acidobacteriia bacterium]|nr:DUF1488 domain-containing protein [Terriglobia bacterium]
MYKKAQSFTTKDGLDATPPTFSREALDDHFGGDDKDKLAVFRANRQVIEQDARRKYLASDTEADGSVLIRTGDL